MLFQELPIPFPVYDKKGKQARFAANSDEPCGTSLLCPKDAFLPFQIRKVTAAELPHTVELFDHEDNLVADVSTDIVGKMVGRTYGGFDYLTYLGDSQVMVAGVALDMAPGHYYLKFTFLDGEVLWSEVFQIPLERFTITDPTTCKFLKLQWSNDIDVDPIHYSNSPAIRLVNCLYLDSIIYNTEPETEQEGTVNGDNVLIPDFQKITVRHVIQANVPDFMKLALAVMPIHKTVTLSTEYALRSGAILRPHVDSKADENGYFSDVTIKFEQDIAIIKRGCGDSMAPDGCPDMPSDDDFAVTVVPGANSTGKGGLILTATIPAGTYADIFTAYSGTPHFSIGKVYRSQLAAGFFIPYSLLWGGTVVIYVRTFNCTVGTTGTFDITPVFEYHPRAMAFFEAIEQDPQFIFTHGNITSNEKNAVNDLVVGLIEGVPATWDELDAIYPFIGNNPHAFKYNLKDPRDSNDAFRLTIPNGMVVSSAGMGLSGVNQYAGTHWNPAVLYPGSPSVSMNAWLSAVLPITGSIGGAQDAFGNIFEMLFSGSNLYGMAFDRLSPFVDALGAGGMARLYSFSMRGLFDGSLYVNGAPVYNIPAHAGSVAVTGTPPNAEVAIGVNRGAGSPAYLVGTYSIFTLGKGIGDALTANLYSLVMAFNSTLGR